MIGNFLRNVPNGRKRYYIEQEFGSIVFGKVCNVCIIKSKTFVAQKSGVDELIIILSFSVQLFSPCIFSGLNR